MKSILNTNFLYALLSYKPIDPTRLEISEKIDQARPGQIFKKPDRWITVRFQVFTCHRFQDH
jgi:hypothetical protein